MADSGRALLNITPSPIAQTLQGLDGLLQMPFGCGEQNMILFAPDAFILKYLKGTNQLKPEIQAKAETLLITGYQRELTYRRADGSFSAFGDQDPEGSLFLTAFVLKAFAQAGAGLFVAPTAIEAEVCRQYGVRLVARLKSVRAQFYVITVERTLKHPAVVAVCELARQKLFGDGPVSRRRRS